MPVLGKLRSVLKLSLLLWAFSASAESFATTYFVANNGNDSNSGTSSDQAFATIQKAADLVEAGDIVVVRKGTYAGFVLNDPPNTSHRGTASAPIQFLADAGATINSRNRYTTDNIDLEWADYVVLKGFTVINSARNGIRVTHSDHTSILNNIVDHSQMPNIFSSFTSNYLVEGNICTNSVGSHGIYVSNSSTMPTIRGNYCAGNAKAGLECNGDASQDNGDWPFTGLVDSALVENNIFYNNGSIGAGAFNLDGLDNSVVRNNLLYGNLNKGLSLYVLDATHGSQNNLIINNTIVMPTGTRMAVQIENDSTGNQFYNNIFLVGSSSAAVYSMEVTTISGFKSDHNLMTNRFDYGAGGATDPLSAWQSQTGQDMHSLTVADPSTVFANLSKNDFHLIASGLAAGNGVSTSAPNFDLDCQIRAASPMDIGAYALSGLGSAPSCVTPSASGATATGPGIQNPGGGISGNSTDTPASASAGSPMTSSAAGCSLQSAETSANPSFFLWICIFIIGVVALKRRPT